MPSPPILNFEALLAPISGADPAGVPLPYELRTKLDTARKEIRPDQFPPNDPRRPDKPQYADWAGIVQLAQEALSGSTKDLVLAARLTESLVKLHGFAGLRDGAQLMRRMVQECWDRMHPVIVDGDTDVRTGGFEWLDAEDRGSLFPHTLRAVPLTRPMGVDGTEDSARFFGWTHWKETQDPKGKVAQATFDKAVAETSRDYCQLVVDDLAASVDELGGLHKALGEKMGERAPGLMAVRKAVVETQDLAKKILQRKGPPPAPPAPQTPQDGKADANAGASAAAPQPQRAMTRDDVLNRLSEASKQLLEMEPHSPIAYLVQRAVKLARLPLPDLMKTLVRDPGVLGQLDRDLDLGLEPDKAAKPK